MDSAAFTPPALQPGLRADLVAAIERMPASRHVGLKVLGFGPGGVSLLELPMAPQLTFDGRIVQGGIVGLLADYAGVSAAASTLEPGWAASTTGFSVHNIAPAVGQRLLAVGRAASVGRAHAVSSVEVWAIDGERATRVALGSTTCRPLQLGG